MISITAITELVESSLDYYPDTRISDLPRIVDNFVLTEASGEGIKDRLIAIFQKMWQLIKSLATKFWNSVKATCAKIKAMVTSHKKSAAVTRSEKPNRDKITAKSYSYDFNANSCVTRDALKTKNNALKTFWNNSEIVLRWVATSSYSDDDGDIQEITDTIHNATKTVRSMDVPYEEYGFIKTGESWQHSSLSAEELTEDIDDVITTLNDGSDSINLFGKKYAADLSALSNDIRAMIPKFQAAFSKAQNDEVRADVADMYSAMGPYAIGAFGIMSKLSQQYAVNLMAALQSNEKELARVTGSNKQPS